MQARNLSSALSAASSACDHIYNWVNGTPADTWVSMAVFSDGSYNAPKVCIGSNVMCAAVHNQHMQGQLLDAQVQQVEVCRLCLQCI